MSADELAKLLDELGRRLGPAGEHVFQLAIQRMYIEAIVGIVGSVVIATGALVIMRWTYQRHQKAAAEESKNYPWSSKTDAEAVLVAGWGIGGCALFVAVVTTWGAVIQVLTPEYSVLKMILEALK